MMKLTTACRNTDHYTDRIVRDDLDMVYNIDHINYKYYYSCNVLQMGEKIDNYMVAEKANLFQWAIFLNEWDIHTSHDTVSDITTFNKCPRMCYFINHGHEQFARVSPGFTEGLILKELALTYEYASGQR